MRPLILKSIYLSVLLFFTEHATAQLFTEVSYSKKANTTLEVVEFKVNKDEISKFRAQKSESLQLQLPFYNNQTLSLSLEEFEIHSPDFKLIERSANGDKTIRYDKGNYYRGKVSTDPSSSVLLALHDGEFSGVVWFEDEVYNFGKEKNDQFHILYNTSMVKGEELGLKCGTLPTDIKPAKQSYNKSSTACSSIVDVYFECDYDMYQNFSSNSTSVTNYVNTMFAEVNNLYSNESIDIQISEIVVWTTSDGYSNGSAALTQFASANSAGINGDIGHLLTNDPGSNGGIAYVDQLCGNLPFAYSDIQNSSQVYPTYSWDVEVVAHEMGHNFGSSHTHDCAWGPNNDTQIDDCGNIATGGGGSCYDASNPIVPSSGGTIMSYCHLNSVGINFSNGFGAEPGDLIRTKHSNCFCDNSSCTQALIITSSGTFSAQPNNGNGASNSSASHADWFEFSPTTGGTIDIASCNEGVDTRVWLHSGSCTSLNFEAMSDDECTSSGSSNYASEITSYTVVSGTTYFIEWDNRWSTASFSWDFTFTPTGGGGTTVNISCPQDYMGNNTCNASDYNPSITGTATSSTSGANVTYSDQLNTTSCTVVIDRTWLATDVNGNTDSCIQMIDLDDNTSPQVTYCPSNISVTSNSNCEAYVTWSLPTAVDDCTSVTVSSNYNSGTVFNVGNSSVTYTFSDQCSNTSTCDFTITVVDGCGGSSTLDDCDAAHIILNGSLGTDTYRAGQTLSSSGTAAGNAHPVFKAGQTIDLAPGFEIPLGASLEAIIEDCNN